MTDICFADYFGGTDRVTGLLSVCVCMTTLKWNDMWPRCLAWWFTVTWSGSCSQI